ncbi:hypothetical protein T12_8538 [Trichinella patagoniensis]|uniref:Uncharacterized protein n=1 Tax=Trichinella patagoniensis TaxID=990121 RepID=A0A0V0Z1L3_9BILA|nr:hypothetical protein T12_8538 [Trichinella patagoniensis]
MSEEDEEDRLQRYKQKHGVHASSYNVLHYFPAPPSASLLPTAPKGAISPTLRITTL